MITGLDFGYKDGSDKSIEIPGECSFSYGQTLETSSRFAYDYTGTSQSLVRCRRPLARTFSIQYNLTRNHVLDLFEMAAKIEDTVGKTAHLYYNGIDYGLVIVVSASIAMQPDCIDSVSGLSIGLELSDGLEPRKPTKRINVQTVRR